MDNNKICIIWYVLHEPLFNAGSKLPEDIRIFLKQRGAKVIRCNYAFERRWLRLLFIWWYPLRMFFQIPYGSTVIWQHPYDTNCHPTIKIFNRILVRALKLFKSVSTVAVAIDIESLRFREMTVDEEVKTLSIFDKVTVHSEEMRRELSEHGLKSKMPILSWFDYRAEKLNTNARGLSNNVCFAGNLSKSPFIDDLKEIPDVNFKLYGLPEYHPEASNVVYEGKFSASDISMLDGSWGLVWDGTSIDCCDGLYGDYLRYNSPHKASLFTCAHLPMIVPEGTAAAIEVRTFGLGIVVRSLREIPEKIGNVSEREYEEFLANVKRHSEDMLAGARLPKVLFG